MQKRQIGNSDLYVAPMVLGGNVFGWTLNEKESFHIMDRFLEEGYNFIDTADVYSFWAEGNQGGESETIIGNWMKERGNRQDVILATKVGSDFGDGKMCLKPAYIKKAVEGSLKRLQTDYIDLYYSHKNDPDTRPEETLGAYQQLIKEGKVRYIAASNLPAARMTKAMELARTAGLPRYEAIQPEYNLMERAHFETELAPLAEKYGLSVFPYYSLASGFLSGKYRNREDLDKSARGTSVKKYINDKGMAVLKALDKVAQRHDSTPAAIAIAWLLAKPTVTAPIASATKESHLRSLFEAVELRLDKDDMARLDEASAYEKEKV